MIVDRIQHPLTRSEQVENDPISGESVDGSHDSRTPWLPPGLRLPVVGDRVAVRLSAECSWVDQRLWTDHTSDVDGAVGRVWRVAPPGVFADRHDYFVKFEEPWPLTLVAGARRVSPCGSFAAIELEILAVDDGAGAR